MEKVNKFISLLKETLNPNVNISEVENLISKSKSQKVDLCMNMLTIEFEYSFCRFRLDDERKILIFIPHDKIKDIDEEEVIQMINKLDEFGWMHIREYNHIIDCNPFKKFRFNKTNRKISTALSGIN